MEEGGARVVDVVDGGRVVAVVVVDEVAGVTFEIVVVVVADVPRVAFVVETVVVVNLKSRN